MFDGAFGMIPNKAFLRTPGALMAEIGCTVRGLGVHRACICVGWVTCIDRVQSLHSYGVFFMSTLAVRRGTRTVCSLCRHLQSGGALVRCVLYVDTCSQEGHLSHWFAGLASTFLW